MTETAVVTGASSGLGLQISSRLRLRGLRVIGVSRRGPDVRGDASRRETAQAALAAAGGPIQLLVNCAGSGVFRPAGTYSEEEVEGILRSNLITMINFCDVLLPQIKGTIVNVMSTAALSGKVGETVYCAAKWGARGYTEALRAEVGTGRRVLAVYPGGMDTPFWGGDPKAAGFMAPEYVAAKIVEAIFDSDSTELILRRPGN